jgi:hypothetical protein
MTRSRARTLRGTTLAALLAATAAACTNDAARERADTTVAVVDTAPARTATAVAAMLSDENVLAVLDTGYAALAAVDRMAATTAADTGLRSWAARANDANVLSRRAVSQTATQLGVTPVLPDDDVLEEFRDAMSDLRGKTGADFDRRYAGHADDLREEMIDEIDDALERADRRNEMRTMLQQVRATLDAQRKELASRGAARN